MAGSAATVADHDVPGAHPAAFIHMRTKLKLPLAKKARNHVPVLIGLAPLANGGLVFDTGMIRAPLLSGAIANSTGSLPYDRAVDRDCELARRFWFHRGDRR